MDVAMTSLLGRLRNIARAQLGGFFDRPGEPAAGAPAPDEGDAGYHFDEAYQDTDRQSSGAPPPPQCPPQVVKDLEVFGLSPAATWDDVRRARNREVKKYHSDRFVNDPQRLETSKEIMQIMNAAYERLENHYADKKG
jgi:DnaJ-domain-containing protein 1